MSVCINHFQMLTWLSWKGLSCCFAHICNPLSCYAKRFSLDSSPNARQGKSVHIRLPKLPRFLAGMISLDSVGRRAVISWQICSFPRAESPDPKAILTGSTQIHPGQQYPTDKGRPSSFWCLGRFADGAAPSQGSHRFSLQCIYSYGFLPRWRGLWLSAIATTLWIRSEITAITILLQI